MSRTLALVGAVGALLLLPAPEPAHAGVIVLKNGNVIVGRIRDEEVNKESITVRWPYKDRTERGHQEVERFRVRWYDTAQDLPTDAYWEQYSDTEEFPIDDRYLGLLERWKLRKESVNDGFGEITLVDPFQSGDRTSLNPIPVENETFRIQKPEGWTSSIEDGITVFVSDESGKEGFRPRIHVFSMESVVKGRIEDQILWLEQQMGRLADKAGGFEVREKARLRPRGGGFDQEMLTRTVRLDRPVLTLRKLLFRKKRTYVFAAYAHEQDYTGRELLFQACMRSLEIFEDTAMEAAAAAASKEAGQQEKPDEPR